MTHLPLKLMAVAILLASTAVQAKEGGDQYPNGAEGFMAGALLPPGSYFINYAGHYAGENAVGVKVDATFDALRAIHVSKYKILGGDFAFGAVVPLVSQKITLSNGVKIKDSGIGDIAIHPFALGWHQKNLHSMAGLEIDLPTGKDGITANYRSYEPFAGVTYLSDSGFEASTKLMYTKHEKNKDTNYRSGDEFHMDYLVGQHKGDWAYGVGGYYLTQLKDDKQNGVNVDNRGQVFAIGPQLKYDRNGQSFIVKWDRETNAKNRFEGDKVWFKYVTVF